MQCNISSSPKNILSYHDLMEEKHLQSFDYFCYNLSSCTGAITIVNSSSDYNQHGMYTYVCVCVRYISGYIHDSNFLAPSADMYIIFQEIIKRILSLRPLQLQTTTETAKKKSYCPVQFLEKSLQFNLWCLKELLMILYPKEQWLGVKYRVVVHFKYCLFELLMQNMLITCKELWWENNNVLIMTSCCYVMYFYSKT